MPLIFKHPDDETLYEQLIDRLYHIERAFLVRRHIKLHYSVAVSEEVAKSYLVVRSKYDDFFSTYEESLLWFITVELWSRFLYKKTKKGLLTLVGSTNSTDINEEYESFINRHETVISYIETQRNKYFAHADEVKAADYPNVWDKEYELLLDDIKTLMTSIGRVVGSQRVPTSTHRSVENVTQLFDDLLQFNSPSLNVKALSEQYNSDVDKFLKG